MLRHYGTVYNVYDTVYVIDGIVYATQMKMFTWRKMGHEGHVI